MPLKRDDLEAIRAVITSRTGEDFPGCGFCGQNELTLLNGVVNLVVSDWITPPQLALGDARVLPCVALICNVCGNTYLLNVSRLGLEPYFAPRRGV